MLDIRKIIREEILNERLNEIDSDVNLLYDEYFKESIDSIQRGDLITYDTFKKNVSNTLYLDSEDAKKAHQLNPCPIQINYSSNFYNPHQNIISISIHQEAVRLVLDSKGSIEDAANMLRNQKQRNSFLQEFTEEKIKGSIHHELLHWIDDTFNNRHIRKTMMRANELGTKDIKGIPVNSTKIEIQGQMGNVKQLYNKFIKLNRLDDWNNLSFIDLTNLLPTLNTVYNQLKDETRDGWIRNLRTRMHREGVLGDNMKYLNESSNTLISIKKIIREEVGNIFKNVINESVKSEVKLSDLYVEDDNILDAYFKAKNNLGPSSRSTGKPLAVTKLLDGSLILMDGHHRVIDRIKYLSADNIDDILNLRFDAIITSENYEDLDDYPDGEYWLPLFDWIYNMEEHLLGEDINIPVSVGDEIMTGKFKNKKTKIKTIDKNEKGDLTINDKPALKFRIPEKIKEDVSNHITCKSCDWEWAVETSDKNPHLCHKCGYDNEKNEFDNVTLNAWKKENNIK